eukprot:6634245-Alexandrium_andersonii.AAC.1
MHRSRQRWLRQGTGAWTLAGRLGWLRQGKGACIFWLGQAKGDLNFGLAQPKVLGPFGGPRQMCLDLWLGSSKCA